MTFVLGHRFRRAALAASLVATTTLAGILPAAAIDPTGNAIADAFLAGIEASGAKDLKVGSVTGDDDTTEITGLETTLVDGTDEAKLVIDRIAVDEADLVDGRIEAGSIELTGVAITNKEGKFTAGKASADGVTIPSADDFKAGPEAATAQSVYDNGRIEGIVIASADGYTVPIESIEFDADDIVDGVARKLSLAANRIVLDVASMPDKDTQAELQKLGYERLTLSFATAGSWDPEAATATLDELKIEGENAGSLVLSASIGGLTEDVVKKLQETEDSDEQMQILQGLTVKSVSIRFDDASLTNRLLTAQAKETGTTAETLADQLSAALPSMLAMLQNPTFEKSVAAAAGTFLKTPGSITASAAPANPVPIAMIVGTVMMAPQTLPDVLGVTVTSQAK